MDQLISHYGAGFGLGGIAVLIVLVLIRGDFIPRRTHDQIVRDKDAQIERESNRADEWQQAYRVVAEAQQVSAAALSEVVEHAKATERVMTALQAIVHPEAGGS